MKVLIVCSGNLGRINPFISDQALSLNNIGIETEFFPVKGKGIKGYLKNLPRLQKLLKHHHYDLVHAHYGLSGMLAVLQRRKPAVITFHGTDVNARKNKYISLMASRLSAYNILVIDNFIEKLRLTKNYSVIPCGVDLEMFHLVPKAEAREKMKLDPHKKIILFSSRFDNRVKNAELAKKAAAIVRNAWPDMELMELKGYSRNEVSLLMNAADALLVTSFTESGPLVVKEALACNLPVVSTNVGDVGRILSGVQGAYVTSYDPEDIAEKLGEAIRSGKRILSRQKIAEFEIGKIAFKLKSVYETTVNGKA